MASAKQRKTSESIQVSVIQAAQKVAASFTAAFKYYSLYPEGHAFSTQYLSRFKSDLDQFLQDHKKLRLDISKNSFSFKGAPVFTGIAEENNPAYLLSRDRILFLEFRKQVEMAEISQLLDILKRHRNPTENTDSDIATTLWHYRFDHISYEAADIFAMEAIEFELSMFKAAPRRQHADGGTAQDFTQGQYYAPGMAAVSTTSAEPGPAGGGTGHAGYPGEGKGAVEPIHDSDAPSSLMLLAGNSNLAELEPAERNWLEFVVRQEDDRDFTSDVIDILLITLAVEGNEIDFATTLELLEFEFFDTLIKEEFSQTLKIVKNVHNIAEALKDKKNWAVSLINLFLSSLAREERLEGIPWINNYGSIAANPGKNVELLNTLQYLGPEIIFTLGRLLGQTPKNNTHLRLKITQLIAARTRENPDIFCRLIEESGEETNLLLLQVTEELEQGQGEQAYLQMTHHPSAEIRKAGMDGLFRLNLNPQPETVAHLMEDRDRRIRERMLTYLEQFSSSLREKLLISFLAQEHPSISDELHIMQCYRLLSTCASQDSITFLQRILLESDLKSMFNNIRQAHKKGAAYALRVLDTPETREILTKGAESMRPDVRQACKKVLGL